MAAGELKDYKSHHPLGKLLQEGLSTWELGDAHTDVCIALNMHCIVLQAPWLARGWAGLGGHTSWRSKGLQVPLSSGESFYRRAISVWGLGEMQMQMFTLH